MKFLAITLIVHAPNPITGVQKPTYDRFREVINNATLAEELGFDGFGVGERHERPFISSSPPVVLSHIAARSPRSAARVRDRVRTALDALAEHPGLGARTSNPRLRRLVLRPYPYLLFYEAREAEVVVIGLRHAARDPGTMPGVEDDEDHAGREDPP